MIRGEKDVQEFYFQALRKTMKRKTKAGVGIAILNNRMYSKGWRPLLPLGFERSYPKLSLLIKRCWSQKKEERPGFDEIVKVMQGGIAAEVRRKEEPEIILYKEEVDVLYHERMGKDEVFEEDEEEAGGEDKEGAIVSKRKYDEAMARKDKVLAELKEKVARLEEREQARELEKRGEVKEVKEVEKRGLKSQRTEAEMRNLMAMLGKN